MTNVMMTYALFDDEGLGALPSSLVGDSAAYPY